MRGGIAQLWECTSGADVLHVVTRLDENPREWVFCYARGTGITKFAPHFLAVADAKRWPVRVHTTSPALVRMARRFGFGRPEFILRR